MSATYTPLDEYELSDAESLGGIETTPVQVSEATPAPQGSTHNVSETHDDSIEPDPFGNTAAPKRRRAAPLPKLDADRMLSENGLPMLKEKARKIRLAGKGHEDLKKILGFYEKWAHQLYPRYSFEEFAIRAETLCHTRRMQMALGMWRSEMSMEASGTPMDVESTLINQGEQQAVDEDVTSELERNEQSVNDIDVATTPELYTSNRTRTSDEAFVPNSRETNEDEHTPSTLQASEQKQHEAESNVASADEIPTSRSASPEMPVRRRIGQHSQRSNKWLSLEDESEPEIDTVVRPKPTLSPTISKQTLSPNSHTNRSVISEMEDEEDNDSSDASVEL